MAGGAEAAAMPYECHGAPLREMQPLSPLLTRMVYAALASATGNLLPCCGARRRGGEPCPLRWTWQHASCLGTSRDVSDFAARVAAGGRHLFRPTRFALATAGCYGATFPSTMHILADTRFPWPLLGSVHVSSDVLIPDLEALLLRLGAAAVDDAAAAAAPPLPSDRLCDVMVEHAPASQTRVHKRGTLVDIRTSLSTCASSAGAPHVLCTSVTTLLFFHKRRADELARSVDSEAPADGVAASIPAPAVTAAGEAPAYGSTVVELELILPPNFSRAWAHFSGDVNPIHMHAIPAWLLGFRQGAIAHGMSVVYAALSTLEQHAAWPPQLHELGCGGVRMRAEFVRPVSLPASLSVRLCEAVPRATSSTGAQQGSWVVDIVHPRSGKVHVRCELSCA